VDLIVVQVVELLLPEAQRLRVVSRLAARDKDRDLKEQVLAARVVLGVDAVEDSTSTTSSNGYQQFPSLMLRSATQSSFPVRRALIPLA
jgi:hypothetical protein